MKKTGLDKSIKDMDFSRNEYTKTVILENKIAKGIPNEPLTIRDLLCFLIDEYNEHKDEKILEEFLNSIVQIKDENGVWKNVMATLLDTQYFRLHYNEEYFI